MILIHDSSDISLILSYFVLFRTHVEYFPLGHIDHDNTFHFVLEYFPLGHIDHDKPATVVDVDRVLETVLPRSIS
jgi:hypothetical protein